jgi:hypothetical protein
MKGPRPSGCIEVVDFAGQGEIYGLEMLDVPYIDR